MLNPTNGGRFRALRQFEIWTEDSPPRAMMEKAAIEALNTWVETVAKATPKPQLFPANKDMQEAAASWFKFNNEMLELQREFALSFVKTVAPLSAES